MQISEMRDISPAIAIPRIAGSREKARLDKTLADLMRWIAARDLVLLPRAKLMAAERWLRGRREFRRLAAADCVVVSRGKSGRTWFRIMLSRYFQQHYGLAEQDIIGFDNLHAKNPAIPKVFFTHDSHIGHYTGDANSKSIYYRKKVILLVRDPADTAVSSFFHWKHRMKQSKRVVWGRLDDKTPIYDFVMHPEQGLPGIVRNLNSWAAALPQIERRLVVRYEDLRADPAAELENVVAFLGQPCDAEAVAEAVRFASFENMRAMESRGALAQSSRRLLPGDDKNEASFKTRRGKVGGYRDYFDAAQLAEIDRLVRDELSPEFGYGPAGGTDRAQAG